MAADTTLVLGDFTFAGVEIPEGIEVGGVQQLVKHELIGGIRVTDAMGRSDDDLVWSGWFMGANAKSRADFLDAYRVSAAQISLTWGGYDFTVIVRGFKPKMRRLYEYSYTITCEIVTDNATASTQGATLSTDDAVSDDMDSASDLSNAIGDDTLSGQIDTLNTAVAAVPTFAVASQSTLNSVLQPLAAAASTVSDLISTADQSLAAPAGFGGIIAGGTALSMAASLTAQVANTQQLTSLVELQGVLGRMRANVTSSKASDNAIAVAGGNLFAIAALQYGDATAWPTIAAANGLTDPFVSGPQTLTIPPLSGDTEGILEA